MATGKSATPHSLLLRQQRDSTASCSHLHRYQSQAALLFELQLADQALDYGVLCCRLLHSADVGDVFLCVCASVLYRDQHMYERVRDILLYIHSRKHEVLFVEVLTGQPGPQTPSRHGASQQTQNVSWLHHRV